MIFHDRPNEREQRTDSKQYIIMEKIVKECVTAGLKVEDIAKPFGSNTLITFKVIVYIEHNHIFMHLFHQI